MTLFVSGLYCRMNFSSVKHVISSSRIRQASFRGRYQIMTMEGGDVC